MRYFLIILGCLLYACAGTQAEPEAAPKAEPVEAVEAVEPAAEAPAEVAEPVEAKSEEAPAEGEGE